MEMRNFITAREMIQEGNWWFTTLNLEPRLEKPPLPTWLTAFSVLTFGDLNNYYSLRLPAAIISTLMVFFFYGFIKEISNKSKLPLIGAIVLATSFLIIQQGRSNSWDIYTHAFMVGSIWLLTRAFINDKWQPVIGATLFMGLSVLSKGPVSLYALWIPFIIAYGLIDGKVFYKQHWPKIVVVLLVGLLIGFSWNIYMYVTQLEATEYVLNKETTSWANRHTRSVIYYLHFPIFIGLWIFTYVSGFFYKYAKPKIQKLGNYKFILFWGLIVIVFLSVIPTKKERYLLPALIPMALLASYMLYSIYSSFKANNQNKWDILIVNIHSYFIGFLSIIAAIGMVISKYDSINFLTSIGCLLLLINGLAILYFNKLMQIVSLYKCTIAVVVIYCIFLLPQTTFWGYKNDNYKNIADIQGYKELNNLSIYIENPETDINILWPAGKPTQAMNKIDYSNKSLFPLTIITINPLEDILSDSIKANISIQSFGIHDLFRKESKYKTRIYRVEQTP